MYACIISSMHATCSVHLILLELFARSPQAHAKTVGHCKFIPNLSHSLS